MKTINESVSELKAQDFKEDIGNLVKACKYPIGTKYTARGKDYEIIDVLLTFNASGEWVKTRYVVKHQLIGQDIISNDVVDVTIDRAIWDASHKQEA